MQGSPSENQKEAEIALPPPPPAFLSLNLSPPTITEHSYTLHYERKHQAMINGEAVFSTQKEEVEAKLKKELQEAEKHSRETESTGEKQLRNLEICSKCQKCGYWIEKDEMKTHMSFHVAFILPGLLLGDKHSSTSRKELFQRNSVTHVLNTAAELKNYFEPEGKVVYLKLTLEDQIGESIVEEATKGAAFIDQSIKEGGVVFVHCAMGKSRSVSSILMYLMVYRGMGYDEGLKLVRATRPLARPNPTYEEELREFEKSTMQGR